MLNTSNCLMLNTSNSLMLNSSNTSNNVTSNNHTTKHLHSTTFVLNRVMFMFQSGGLGNGCFFP